MRERRRKAARKARRGALERERKVSAPKELDADTLNRAEAILQELQEKGISMSPQAFARRLGVDVTILYHCAQICERLSVHNKQFTTPLPEMIEAKLNELRTQGKTMTTGELARFFSISRRQFFQIYPEYSKRLDEQNRAIQIEQAREVAEQHLQELMMAQNGQKTREFARHIHIDHRELEKWCPDILERLKRLNKDVGLPGVWGYTSRDERIARIYEYWNKAVQSGETLSLAELAERCHFVPQTIRQLCPELIAQLAGSPEDKQQREEEALSMTFATIGRSKQVWALKHFAAAAGVPVSAMRVRYRYWMARLSEHNAAVVSAKLQAAWDRMVSSEEIWTIVRFAREAGMGYQTLQDHHQSWVERFRMWKARHSISEQVCAMIEDARRSNLVITPAEAARKLGITYTTLMRHHSEQYAALVAYYKAAFGPVVDAALRKVCESDQYPTLSEFAQMCGLQHFSILLAYFPDSAQQIRERLRLME